MSIFLFLKQLVDLLYPYQWLDYVMVGMAVVALVYQFLLVKPDIRKAVTVTDVCVLVYAILLTVHFAADVIAYKTQQDTGAFTGYGSFVKPLSALLLYFLGRIYYERIQECGGALAASSYVVVYVNFIYRLSCFGSSLFLVENAGGDLYYYDTDMAYAMLVSFVFILMYARNTVLKLVTVCFTVPYMVLCSDAGIQKVLMIAVVILILFYLLEKIGVPGKVSNGLLITAVAGLLLIAADLVLPSAYGGRSLMMELLSGRWLNAENLYNSYSAWHKGWQEVWNASWAERLIGIFDRSDAGGNFYVGGVTATGLLGTIGFLLVVASSVLRIPQMKDRKTCYVTLLLGLIFLGTGVTTKCMEFTQMSWFVFMFLGMSVSSVKGDGMEQAAALQFRSTGSDL